MSPVVVQARPLPPDVEIAYTKYLRDHHGDLTDTQGLAETMYRAGSRVTLAASVAFADIPGQLRYLEDQVSALSLRIHALAAALEAAMEKP